MQTEISYKRCMQETVKCDAGREQFRERLTHDTGRDGYMTYDK